MSAKWNYYVNLHPIKTVKKGGGTFSLKKPTESKQTSKDPELRVMAFNRADANSIKESVEKGGTVKAEIEKTLSPERTVTATQRITGSLRSEQYVEHDELRDNINSVLPQTQAILPDVPSEKIFVDTQEEQETREDSKEPKDE
jgi:hypothetical protein